MPAYKYEALDANGKSSTGIVEAETVKAARAHLRGLQLVPLGLTPRGRHRGPGRQAQPVHAEDLLLGPAWPCGRASSPAWWARACRWSAR